MSDNQTVWTILWERAAADASPGTPFEIDEVVPTVAESLKVSEDKARRLINRLLGELERLPDGHQFFTREGNAVVPLSGFLLARGRVSHPVEMYPYEL
jgi:hypothetical protein